MGTRIVRHSVVFLKGLAVPLVILAAVAAGMWWQGFPQFSPSQSQFDPAITQQVRQYMDQQCDVGRRRVGITSCDYAVVATDDGKGGEQFVLVRLDYTAPDGTPHSISWLFTFDDQNNLQDVV